MKVCTIAGRLTKDCQVQENEGRQFATFSVAVDDGYGQNKGVMFFDVTYHRSAVAQYLTKGTKVCVSGELKQREYNGKTYLSIRAADLSLMGGGKPREEPTRNFQSHQNDMLKSTGHMDDEIPF